MTKQNMRLYLRALKKIPKGDKIYVAYGAKYWCTNKFPFHVHLKAIRAYDVDIVNSTEETDKDWHKLKNYRRLLRALGLLAEDRSTGTTKRKRDENGECDGRVKHKSDFAEYDKTVVIK